MSNLIALLSLYYACDVLVIERPLSLSPPELAQCMSHYEAVKEAFTDGDLAPPGTRAAEAQRRAAYVAFKAWERKNADVVTELRALVRTEVLGQL